MRPFAGRTAASRGRALLAVAAPLVWHDAVLPRLGLDIRGRTAANVAFATGYARLCAGQPRWRAPAGWRRGFGAAAAVLAGYGAALTFSPTRRILAGTPDRAPGVSVAEWIGVHIPLGTVYSEELIFRGTLDGIAGTPLTALVFGLWHIAPARAAGDPILPTVAATTAAGLVFGALRRSSGSATAPALLHYALNAGGAITPRLARSRAKPATAAG
ncbi:CPBP family intramembrane glutamic endopeptidase [Nocardia asteroides]|uniref:CPBP family intramembrane glutamic endopeptidase n=1 Tax=Nocardia asteroides TaxID=1824 RepID=UPI001E3D0832|nr:type II CAAX endopeptidase family protein [Nocardia asteroides]UGT59736.1 CPBP family intramembrane metalloprotease [Nocardia asteroides]